MNGPRTAAATAARTAQALRRRLSAEAADLRHYGFVVIVRASACESCRRISDSSIERKPRP